MYHGIVNVYKERGFTSHDAVAKLRGILGQRKIGHTGTLDPDAEGVLPVCLGSGTKLCDLLTNRDKVYETVLLLGVTTDTLDITGTVTEKIDWERFVSPDGAAAGSVEYQKRREQLEERIYKVLSSFEGKQMQIPPMYSALKVNGRKLVDLARTGAVVERKPREVEIYSIRVLSMELPRIRLLVHCGRGTYIRSLCDDIGRTLNCGGCMESLVRRAVGPFRAEDAKTLDEIRQLHDSGELEQYIIPPDAVFDYPSVCVDASYLIPAINGNPIPPGKLGGRIQRTEKNDRAVTMPDEPSGRKTEAEAEFIKVYLPDGRFLGIYRRSKEKGIYTPEKIFLTRE